MGRKRKQTDGQTEQKKVPVKLAQIPRIHAGKVTDPWKILETLIDEMIQWRPSRFEHLKLCTIRMWWVKDWKADADGIAIGAQVCKASEVDRLLVEESKGDTPDIFIKLPREQWPNLQEEEKRHRLFHELCHIRPSMDPNGKQKIDSKNRLLWRLGRHEIVAFREEIEWFGTDRVVGHNGAIIAAAERTDRPMFDQFDKAGQVEQKPKDADGWKTLPLTELGLPRDALSYLQLAGYGTIGALSTFLSTDRQWAKNVKVDGVRRPANLSNKVVMAYESFWQQNPHYTA